MIQEQGVVTEVAPGRARVRTERSASCQDCGAREACACLGGGREGAVWVTDPVGTRVGDRVMIAIPAQSVLRASLLAYLLPAACLVLGALAGDQIAPKLGLPADLGAAAGGVALAALSFAAARRWAGVAVAAPRILRKV